jgi:ATP-dependent helicase/nuclease subunit A
MSGDEEGRERGLAIHRFLDLLSGVAQPDLAAIRRRISTELALDENIYPLAEWQAEALHILTHPAFREWFDPDRYDYAFKEVPIYYYAGNRLVHGVVDRLVIKEDSCTLIDYKTHRSADVDKLAVMAAPYHEQMQLYTEGIKRLWPDKTVRAVLLFTACAGIYTWQDSSVS